MVAVIGRAVDACKAALAIRLPANAPSDYTAWDIAWRTAVTKWQDGFELFRIGTDTLQAAILNSANDKIVEGNQLSRAALLLTPAQ